MTYADYHSFVMGLMILGVCVGVLSGVVWVISSIRASKKEADGCVAFTCALMVFDLLIWFVFVFNFPIRTTRFPQTHPQAYSVVENYELPAIQWNHIILHPQIVCLECGKVNWQENTPVYCIDCGAKLYDETKCPNCGADISGGYCSQCGFDLLEFWGSEVGE